MRTVKQAWESYRQRFMAANSSNLQIEEAQRAFYAAVNYGFEICAELGARTDLSKYDIAAIIENIHKECRDFADQINKG